MIINDRVDIARALGADGVHLGQSDLSVSEARAILGPDAIIGISLENMTQLGTSAGADYAAVSPLFDTATKEDITPPWELAGLAMLCKATGLPLVVVGGIKPGHVPAIFRSRGTRDRCYFSDCLAP